MILYTIKHNRNVCRFPGDKLAHDIYDVLRDGKVVATICNLMYRPRWSVSLSPVRGLGQGLPEWPHSPLAWKTFDAGPFDTIQEAFGIAQERAEFIIQYREGSQCCPC
jgi:hypothetical protein